MYPKFTQVPMFDTWILYLINFVFVTMELCIFTSFEKKR